MGHLAKDPDYRSTQTGSSVCELTVAFDRHGKNGQRDTTFLKLSVWGKLADNCHKYLSKGSLVHAAGYLKQERWQDKNGLNRSEIKLVAEQIQFMPSGKPSHLQQRENQSEGGGIDPEYGPKYKEHVPAQQQAHKPRFYGDPGASYQPSASTVLELEGEEVPF